MRSTASYAAAFPTRSWRNWSLLCAATTVSVVSMKMTKRESRELSARLDYLSEIWSAASPRRFPFWEGKATKTRSIPKGELIHEDEQGGEPRIICSLGLSARNLECGESSPLSVLRR